MSRKQRRVRTKVGPDARELGWRMQRLESFCQTLNDHCLYLHHQVSELQSGHLVEVELEVGPEEL